MDKKTTTVYVSLGYNDYKLFFRYYFKMRYKTVWNILTVVAVIFAFAGVLLIGRGVQLPALALIWAALMLAIYPRNMYRTAARRMKKAGSVTSRISFYDDKLCEERAGEKNMYSYSSLYKSCETASYIYIFCTRREALVIPKDRFRSEDECNAVKALIGIS